MNYTVTTRDCIQPNEICNSNIPSLRNSNELLDNQETYNKKSYNKKVKWETQLDTSPN